MMQRISTQIRVCYFHFSLRQILNCNFFDTVTSVADDLKYETKHLM